MRVMFFSLSSDVFIFFLSFHFFCALGPLFCHGYKGGLKPVLGRGE